MSYTTLYFDLVAEIKGQDILISIRSWIFSLVVIGWLATIFMAVLNPSIWGYWFFAIGGFITGYVVILWLIVWISYLAWAGSRNPETLMPRLTAKLLITEKRPYSNEHGLQYSDLKRLNEIATAEQASADWRGNFISLAVFGLILGGITVVFDPPAALTNLFSTPTPAFMPEVALGELRPLPKLIPARVQNLANAFNFLIVLTILIAILRQLLIYLDRFMATEPANRAIIFATQEAIALLDRVHIKEERPLTLAEKRHLAMLLGFRLRVRQDYSVPLYVDDHNNNWWHLDPISNIPNIDQRRKYWYRFLGWGRRMLKRFKKG